MSGTEQFSAFVPIDKISSTNRHQTLTLKLVNCSLFVPSDISVSRQYVTVT